MSMSIQTSLLVRTLSSASSCLSLPCIILLRLFLHSYPRPLFTATSNNSSSSSTASAYEFASEFAHEFASELASEFASSSSAVAATATQPAPAPVIQISAAELSSSSSLLKRPLSAASWSVRVVDWSWQDIGNDENDENDLNDFLRQVLLACQLDSDSDSEQLLFLDLSGNRLCNAGMKDLVHAILEKTPHIRFLNLTANHIRGEGIGILANYLCSYHILSLNLSGNNLALPGATLAICHLLANSCSLHSLLLIDCYLEEPDLVMLAASLMENRHLLSLDLSFNRLNSAPRGLEELAAVLRSKTTALTFLSLSSNDLRESVGVLLTALKCNSSLQFLDLFQNSLKDKEIMSLANMLEVNSSLVALDLSCAEITADGMNQLMKSMKTNRSVLALILTHCRLTDESTDARLDYHHFVALHLQSNERISVHRLSVFLDKCNENALMLSILLPRNTPEDVQSQLEAGLQRNQNRFIDNCKLILSDAVKPTNFAGDFLVHCAEAAMEAELERLLSILDQLIVMQLLLLIKDKRTTVVHFEHLLQRLKDELSIEVEQVVEATKQQLRMPVNALLVRGSLGCAYSDINGLIIDYLNYDIRPRHLYR